MRIGDLSGFHYLEGPNLISHYILLYISLAFYIYIFHLFHVHLWYHLNTKSSAEHRETLRVPRLNPKTGKVLWSSSSGLDREG